MSVSRREFLKYLGIGLAGLLTAHCVPACRTTCYAVVPSTPTVSLSGSSPTPEHERLRRCWLGLDELAEQTQKDSEGGQRAQQELVSEHRTALDALVADGQLDQPVADQVQVAFEAAAYHVWCSNAPITCYEPMIVDFKPTSSDDLVHRAELLAESSDLDPDTVALAQTAIARDMAFLGLSPEETRALYDKIIQENAPGTPYPDFEEVEFEISPETAQAAQFLVELLLEE